MSAGIAEIGVAAVAADAAEALAAAFRNRNSRLRARKNSRGGKRLRRKRLGKMPPNRR
jgi:hypothetical protein